MHHNTITFHRGVVGRIGIYGSRLFTRSAGCSPEMQYHTAANATSVLYATPSRPWDASDGGRRHSSFGSIIVVLWYNSSISINSHLLFDTIHGSLVMIQNHRRNNNPSIRPSSIITLDSEPVDSSSGQTGTNENFERSKCNFVP